MTPAHILTMVLWRVGRWALLLLIAFPLMRRAQTRAVATGDRSQLRRLVWIRFGVTGAVIGALWAWRADAPLWRHAVGLVVGVMVLGPALRWILARTNRSRPVPAFFLSRRFLVARLAVVLGGLALQWALGLVVARTTAAYVVAGLVASVVAVGGPLAINRASRGAASERSRRRRVRTGASRNGEGRLR